MRKVVLFISLALFSLSSFADLLGCDSLRNRVDAKLQAKGVQTYTLEIISIGSSENTGNPASGVPAAKNNKGKEVGTCDGGTKKIIYTKGN